MKKRRLTIAAILLGAAITVGLFWWHRSSKPTDIGDLTAYNEQVRHGLPADPAIERIAYLEQGWSPADSLDFYSRTQGSRLVPYAWFLALEQPDSEKLFRDNEHIRSLGYLTQKSNELNPDGLPVGFVKDPDLERGDSLGLTCAACHTTEIHHNKVAYRIDGGPTLADIQQLLARLTAAIERTMDDPAKFDRFAERLGTSNHAELRRELQNAAKLRREFDARNRTLHAYGPGRLDAFGHIVNQVLVVDLAVSAPNQARSPDAPVSYPFLWDTPHHDFVQWNGVARNKVLGSDNLGGLARNVGEVLGVFGEVRVSPPHTATVFTGYRSSIRIPDLVHLEGLVRKLQSPQWPEGFPPIDREKAEAGRQLFDQYCVRCHAYIERDNPAREVVAVKTPLKTVGTDPRMAMNFATRTGKTGRIEGRKEYFVAGERFGPEARADAMIVHTIAGVILHSPWKQYRDASLRELRDRDQVDDINSMLVYKTRPLNGIWATAPYLHNGSVPNLYQLLKPSAERIAAFDVGSREFDPVHVGFVATPGAGSFQFRTTDDTGKPIPGNSNAGHE
jgi:cytochrome c2